METLSVLEELNEKLEYAARAADDLEREIEESLPQRRIHKERSAVSTSSVRRQCSRGEVRVLGAPKEVFDVGPGAYDVVSTTLGKRVTGGKWGSNKRFRDRKGKADRFSIGPGQYDPNQSFVMKKRPGVRIVAPTKKTLAAHVKACELEQDARAVGPGKYTPDFFATSEWTSVPRVSIRPHNHQPDEKLQQHLLERESVQAGQAPGAYDGLLRSEMSSVSGVVQWRPACAPKREPEVHPGPGTYDPDISAIKGHVSQILLAPPSEAGSKSGRSALSERSAFVASDDGPGPATYDAQHDFVRPRAPTTVLKRHETKSLKEAVQHEGDILMLNPNDSLAKPNARCSVVMREASFAASQASTEIADDTTSECTSAYDVDLSVLSTKRRSLAFSMQARGHSKRRDLRQNDSLGPGHYTPQYRAVELEPRATRVLQSSSKRANVLSEEGIISSTSLVLDTMRWDRYVRESRGGGPDIGRFSARPDVIPGQVVSDFTGSEDYDTIEAARARWVHTPGVNMTKESKRSDFGSQKDVNPALGPGKYDLDDSLVHPRVPSAFISSTVAPGDGHVEEGEGDNLVLEPTAADGLVRKRILAPVNMEKTGGRVEPKRDSVPEALDYVTDDRDRTEAGKPIPGVVGLRFDGQVGRVEPKVAGEGAHLLGRYHVDYSQVEVQAPAVDFSRGPARQPEQDAQSGEGKDGDVLVLDLHRGHEYMRGSGKLVLDMSKQTARADEVAGQVVSDFTGSEDYDTIEAARARWVHTPSVNMTKESKRSDFGSEKDVNPALGPGKYDLDDSLVHPRVPSAFISSTVAPGDGHVEEGEGDNLVLEPTAADGLVRKRILAPVNMEKTGGRVEPKRDSVPEALDYVTDDRDRTEAGKPIPGVVGLRFDGQVGRVEPKVAGEGAHLLGRYHVDYSQVEVQAPAVDFSRGPARQPEQDAQSGEGKDGDVLVLDLHRGHEYMRGSGKLVLDMSKQTARADEVAGQVVSDFTGSGDYAASEAARRLHAHTPAFDMGKASERKRWAEDKGTDANPRLGPGAYCVDDSLVHPRVPSAFIREAATCEEASDVEGDQLDLDPAGADQLVFRRAPGPIDMARATGRLDPKTQQGPEALDYVADSRGVVEPGAVIPGVSTLCFDGQVGRVDTSAASEASHLHGKYHPHYALVESSCPAWDFGRASGREPAGGGDEAGGERDVQDGDVLVLHPERGHRYLGRGKLVVDMSRQAGRPQEVAGQQVSECDPAQEYAPILDALLPHTPIVAFDAMTGRGQEKMDQEASKLGPGSYDVKDALTHPRAPSLVFGQPPPPPADQEYAQSPAEGDVLVLHPEQADTVTRPAVPGFSNLFQPPALETEWAMRTQTATGPDGQPVAIPSIRRHVEWHRLCERLSAANRPDVYDTDDAQRQTRARVYQESAVDMQRQAGHTRIRVDLGVRWGFTSEGPDALPVLGHIVTGGQIDKAQGARQGDVLVMITSPSGKVADLRRWARPRAGDFTSRPTPKNTSRVVTQLGPWRECAVDVHAHAGCDFEEDGSTFFYHIGTHKRTWTFNQWSQQSYVRQMLAETLEDFGYPLTLHVRRAQSHCLIPIAVRLRDDSMSGAYNPKHELVEASPRGVVDLAAVAGRHLSFDAKTKYDLFRSKLYFQAKRRTPSENLISDAELDAIHAQQIADLRSEHEEKIRELTRRQSTQYEEEMSAIRQRLEEGRSGAEDGHGELRGQEDLFESMMQESVLGDEDARRLALVDQLEKRQAAERRQLRKLIRLEEKAMLAAQLSERAIIVDSGDVKSEVDKAAHRHRLHMDPSGVERLRETERQRRRRLPRKATAGLHHTAEYSHGAPAVAERWLDSGKRPERRDARGISDAEVADWKAHTDYKGLRPLDPLVKWFWQLVESWRPHKRAQVLQLATGTAAAPKGGFASLAGHDIRRPDSTYKFSLRKQQHQTADARAKMLPRAFAPLNRLYLPEYKSKRELAAGLEKALDLMLEGKTADTREARTRMREQEVTQTSARLARACLECQDIRGPTTHMFTILEEDAPREEACPRCRVESGLRVYHQSDVCRQVAEEDRANSSAQAHLTADVARPRF